MATLFVFGTIGIVATNLAALTPAYKKIKEKRKEK